jgi:hypothetical protein
LPPIQYWFTGTALATFLALLGTLSTLGYGWYRAAITELESTHNKIESAAQKAKNERVKALLGRALAAGTGLIEAQDKKDEDRAKRDAETWATQTRNLIAAAYGDGEAALFLDSSGYVFYGDSSEKSKIRNWIDGRMRRITELLRRTDSLTAKDEFNPTQFD